MPVRRLRGFAFRNFLKPLPPSLPAACEAYARSLLLDFFLFLLGCGLIFRFLHRLFEVFDTFTQTLGNFRNLLAAEQQHRDSEHYQKLRSGKATKTSSLKALRKHYGHLSSPIV